MRSAIFSSRERDILSKFLEADDRSEGYSALMTVGAGAYGLNYPHSVDEMYDVLRRLRISGKRDQG